MEPDSVLVRGSHSADPPRPVWHIWNVRADADAYLGEQPNQLVDRLRPARGRLHALVERIASDPNDFGLVTDHRGGAVLSVMAPPRDEAGEADRLGWHLSADVLDFLADLGASISVDEYARQVPLQARVGT